MRIDSAIFSEMAATWDRLHKKARINLVVSGSINRLMNLIFFDDGEPLYGRNTGKIKLMPFRISVLKEILAAHAPRGKYKPEDLLTLWTLTGGVARYVEQLMDEGAVTSRDMLDSALRQSSPILDEGKVVLIQEFGKDYGTYFRFWRLSRADGRVMGKSRTSLALSPVHTWTSLNAITAFSSGRCRSKLRRRGRTDSTRSKTGSSAFGSALSTSTSILSNQDALKS